MKKTSVIIGIILGIVGIIAALLGAPVAGVIGGGVAALLGIGAILLGLSARKAGKGMGAVITGAIALILAVVMTVSSIKMMEAVKEQAQAHKDIAPLVAKYCDNTYLGLLGVVINAANAEGVAIVTAVYDAEHRPVEKRYYSPKELPARSLAHGGFGERLTYDAKKTGLIY
jgi:hypothetical protein